MLVITLSLAQSLFLPDKSNWPNEIDCPLSFGMLSFGNMGRLASMGRMLTVRFGSNDSMTGTANPFYRCEHNAFPSAA
jgi:hypothetical protein